MKADAISQTARVYAEPEYQTERSVATFKTMPVVGRNALEIAKGFKKLVDTVGLGPATVTVHDKGMFGMPIEASVKFNTMVDAETAKEMKKYGDMQTKVVPYAKAAALVAKLQKEDMVINNIEVVKTANPRGYGVPTAVRVDYFFEGC